MKLNNFLNALENLIEERKIIRPSTISQDEHDEFSNIIAETLDHTFEMVQMQDIEIKIDKARKIDISAIKQTLSVIKEARPLSITIREQNPLTINPSETIHELEEFIKDSETQNTSRINILFNLDLYCDTRFNRILMTFEMDNPVFIVIQKKLNDKLENLTESNLLLLWSQIKSSFSNDEDKARYKFYTDIIPANFFSATHINGSLRDKCAITIAKYVPLTIKKMFEEGTNFFPIALPGVGKILSITNTNDLSQISSLESALVRTASQIISVYETIVNEHDTNSNTKKSELAQMIGANESGFIFNGDFYQDYKKNIYDNKKTIEDKEKLLLLNIKRLIEYCNAHTKQNLKIEIALRQYKLGQEVIFPSRKLEFDKYNSNLEVYLQKDMCKFLIERNIPAFGKSIGRNQIDLYHNDLLGEDFVIEAKVYRTKRNLTLKKLKENIVQLQSYMDQHEQPKGILAIYNFSNTLIMAPKSWLNQRILIICINLCDSSASQRKSSIEIVESKTNIIDLIEVKNE